jgi:enoyl-CoA hydratase
MAGSDPDRPQWQFIKLSVGTDAAGGPDLPPHVALLTISRAQRLNALNLQVLDELLSAAETCAGDADIRAVVITGEGDRAFVSGADIGEMVGLDVLSGTAFGLKGQAALQALASMPKPVIAAVGGYALGGGLELILACDIRIAGENARFGSPEVTLGICPGFGGSQRLPRLIGPGAAKDLIFSGRIIGAVEARSIGLVEKVVPAGEHLKASLELARQMAAAAPLAVAAAKEAIDRGADVPLAAALRIEAAAFGRCFATEDQKEGMRAFLEKRDRVFRAR